MAEQLNENKNTKQQNKNINDESTLIFPEEIWLLIFSQPSIDLTTILHLKLVSKRFNRLTDDNVCWENINLQQFGFAPSLNQGQTTRSSDANRHNSWAQTLTRSMKALSRRLTVSSPTPPESMLYQKNFFKSRYQKKPIDISIQQVGMTALALQRLDPSSVLSYVEKYREQLTNFKSPETLPDIGQKLIKENAIIPWTVLLAEQDIATAIFGFNPRNHTQALEVCYYSVVGEVLKNNTDEFINSALEWHKKYYDRIKNLIPDKTIGTKEIFANGLFNANVTYVNDRLSVLALMAIIEFSENISLKANAADFLLQKAADQQERAEIIEKLYAEHSKILEKILEYASLGVCCEILDFLNDKYSHANLFKLFQNFSSRFPDDLETLKTLFKQFDQFVDALPSSFSAISNQASSVNSQSDSSVEQNLDLDVEDEIEELKARIASLNRTIVSQQSQIQQLTKSWIFSNNKNEEDPESEVEIPLDFLLAHNRCQFSLL